MLLASLCVGRCLHCCYYTVRMGEERKANYCYLSCATLPTRELGTNCAMGKSFLSWALLGSVRQICFLQSYYLTSKCHQQLSWAPPGCLRLLSFLCQALRWRVQLGRQASESPILMGLTWWGMRKCDVFSWGTTTYASLMLQLTLSQLQSNFSIGSMHYRARMGTELNLRKLPLSFLHTGSAAHYNLLSFNFSGVSVCWKRDQLLGFRNSTSCNLYYSITFIFITSIWVTLDNGMICLMCEMLCYKMCILHCAHQLKSDHLPSPYISPLHPLNPTNPFLWWQMRLLFLSTTFSYISHRWMKSYGS